MHSEIAEFTNQFVKLATEHNRCLETQEYSKRSRINKKLMSMLKCINSFSNPAEVVTQIMDAGDDYATMWISNYALKNGLCVEVVRMKLQAIKDAKRGADSVTAWALMAENNL